MMKNKIKRFFLLQIVCSIISIINVGYVYAEGYSAGYGNSTDNSGGDSCTSSGCYIECCSIETEFSAWSEINIDMKDMYGNEITGIFDSNISTKILAGTYIDLKVYESKGYTSSARYTYTKEKKIYTCTDFEWSECAYYSDTDGDGRNDDCIPDWVDVGSYEVDDCGGCDANDVLGGYRTEYIAGDASACAASAVPYSMELTPSYSAKYKDSNDITSEPHENDRYYTAEEVNPVSCTNPETMRTDTSNEEKKSKGEKLTKSGTCYFEYNRGKTCINVKTGKVAYGTDCEEDEIELQSEDGYWRYFVPLNANSKDGFSFSLESSKNVQKEGICKNIIEKYDNYASIISDKNGNELPKITNDMTNNEKIAIRNTAIKIVTANTQDDDDDGGCLYTTIVYIPVEQKFYNELYNKDKDRMQFKGFNFYYKPIDISNPFPNGIDNTSIWYDWSNDDTKTPDLTKSYSTITYEAPDIDTETIRKYNKEQYVDEDGKKHDNPYNSWVSMKNILYDGSYKGISDFIEKEGIVERITDVKSIYGLGCGQANENEYLDEAKTIKNPLYQKECDKP